MNKEEQDELGGIVAIIIGVIIVAMILLF